MAFVQLEDPSGSVEVTVFPKAFARTKDLWRTEALLLVKGKVDLRDGKLQILCDSAEEYVIEEDPEASRAVTTPPPSIQFAIPEVDEATAAAASSVVEESSAEDDVAMNLQPPDEPPDDAGGAAPSQPPLERRPPPAAASPTKTVDRRIAREPNGSSGGNGSLAVASPAVEASATFHATASATARYDSPRHLRIFLTRTQNHEEDVRRMREVLGLLSTADGRDRFTFYVKNAHGIVQLDFPNHSTDYGQVQGSLNELMDKWGSLDVQ